MHNSPDAIFGEATLGNIDGSALSDIGAAVSGHGPDDGDTGNPTDFNALVQSPLQLGKTLIIYHPHAQHPPEIIDTTMLSYMREPQASLSHPEPWAPFSSRGDFEQAELFIKHNCTNQLINDQLSLNQKQDSGHHHPAHLPSPSMKNAREMHSILREAGSDLDISLVC